MTCECVLPWKFQNIVGTILTEATVILVIITLPHPIYKIIFPHLIRTELDDYRCAVVHTALLYVYVPHLGRRTHRTTKFQVVCVKPSSAEE